MKRSEMIKLIQDTFEFQGLGMQMRAKDADAILDALESAGMSPPKGEYISSGCFHTLRENCSCGPGYHLREWEKE